MAGSSQVMQEVDGDYFRILGRRSELIPSVAKKYTSEVESNDSRLITLLSYVYGEKNPITGNIVVGQCTPAARKITKPQSFESKNIAARIVPLSKSP